MKVLYYGDEFDHSGTSIFLAGPTPRHRSVKSWRPEALEILRDEMKFGGSVFVPEPPPSQFLPPLYDEMVRWEWRHLEAAGCILFWVPRDLERLPCFTTNVEFGYWVGRRPEKVVLGCPIEAPKVRYLMALGQEHKVPWSPDLRGACYHAIGTARGGIPRDTVAQGWRPAEETR